MWLRGLVLAVAALAVGCGKVSRAGPDASRPDASSRADAAQADAATPPDATPLDATPLDAQPWTPAQLSGLVLWLSADTGVTANSSRVSTWMDQSGKNNDASQPTAANQPMLVPGVINGKPVIRFNGSTTSMQIADSPTMEWGTDDFTIEVVVSWTNSTSTYAMIFGKQIADKAPYDGPGLWANYPLATPSSVFATSVRSQSGGYVVSGTSGLNDGTPRLVGARRSGGTNLEARINGGQAGTLMMTSAIDVSSPGYVANLGGQLTGQWLEGDIAEVVAVHGPMTSADLTRLESYLMTKYGL